MKGTPLKLYLAGINRVMSYIFNTKLVICLFSFSLRSCHTRPYNFSVSNVGHDLARSARALVRPPPSRTRYVRQCCSTFPSSLDITYHISDDILGGCGSHIPIYGPHQGTFQLKISDYGLTSG